MIKLEFEHLAGCQVCDEDYRKIELVFMNTKDIRTKEQTVRIYKTGGMETIDILFSLVQERGKLISEIGNLKNELSKEKKEIRKLKEFRDTIIRETKRTIEDFDMHLPIN